MATYTVEITSGSTGSFQESETPLVEQSTGTSEFERFADLTKKLVQTPKPDKNAKYLGA